MLNFVRRFFLLIFIFALSCESQAVFDLDKPLRLTEFYSGDSIVRLEGSFASQRLNVPLADGVEVISARLNIEATSSIALQKQRSILNVRLNNATIAQIPYDPDTPILTTEVDIPERLFRAGANNLSFQVSQHYADQCEDAQAPELWSEIDLYRSSLEIVTKRKDETPVLQDLSNFFSPGLGGQRSVLIASAKGDDARIQSKVFPIVVQALGIRNQYRPLAITTTSLTKDEFYSSTKLDESLKAQKLKSMFYLNEELTQYKEGISVLVGTKDTLSAFLPDNELEKITHAYLGIQKTPEYENDSEDTIPSAFRLIVSGLDYRQVEQAALALASMDDELNPDSSINVTNQISYSTQEFVGKIKMQPEAIYTFNTIGSYSSSFRGVGEFFKQIRVPLPADFYTAESATVKVLLDFAYGAGMGNASVMNVLVNGKLVHGLPLDNPRGQAFDNYRLDVPARYFKAGNNSIEFFIRLRSPDAENICNQIKGAHLMFQLHDTSTIELPAAGKVAKQPDLALFADTSFPYSYANDVTPATIYIGDQSLLDSALTLTTKKAQVLGTLNPSVVIHNGIPDQLAPYSIVLATPTQLNEELFDELGVSMGASNRWSYQIQHALQQEFRSRIKGKEKVASPNYHVVQKSSLGNLGVMLMQRNIASEQNGSLLMLVSQSNQILAERVQDLVSLSMWGQMSGDFFVWEDHKKPLLAMRVSDQFEVGDGTTLWFEYRMWLSNHPWYWVSAVIAIVLLGTLASFIALKRRNKEIEKSW